jgi:phospholipid/cholesterol/gamma-HCH transport system permease protein
MKPLKNKRDIAHIEINDEKTELALSGHWDLEGIADLSNHSFQMDWPKNTAMTINAENVKVMDSAGALFLLQCDYEIKARNSTPTYINLQPQHTEMLTLVDKEFTAIRESKPPQEEKESFTYNVGKETVKRTHEALNFLSLTGEMWLIFMQGFVRFRTFHVPSICSAIYHTGYRALPILGMLSFLIGVVLAYQMGLQLQTYGANIFIVYLTGVAVLREFGPLIAAIIVAGRTSSAFTAEIGMMKVNQEIDALMTMGISPVQRLVLPKTLGLIIVFPLLIFWSDLFGMIGAMVMSKVMLGIGYPDFVARMKMDVGVSNYFIGLSKAPFFAAIIALVGCYQGFCVSSSADSVGFQTTKSVVQAIFLIIIADAFFSVLYSWAGL